MQAFQKTTAPKVGGSSPGYLWFALEIIAAAAVAFFFTWPQYQAVQAGNTQLAADQATLQKLQVQAAAYRTNDAKLQALDTSPVSQALPKTDSTIDLYAYLDTVVQSDNMVLSGIQVTDESATATSTDGSAAGAAPAAMDGSGIATTTPIGSQIPADVGVVKIHLEVSGTEAEFAQLLSSVQSSLRLMDVQGISISAASSGKKSFILDALTYYQQQ